MNKLKITVVIPLYNKSDVIKTAISSVLSQSLLPFELIIIDDGSTDDGADKIKKLNCPLIKLIETDNHGVSAARNLGVSHATGEFVAFLDADDYWSNDFIKTMVKLILQYDEAAVFACNSKVKYTDGRNKSSQRVFNCKGDTGLINNYFSYVCHGQKLFNSSSVIIKKESLQSIGGFPVGITSGEDLLTWARLATRNKIAYIDDELSTIEVPSSVADRKNRSHNEKDEVGEQLIKLKEHVESRQLADFYRYVSHWYEMRTLIFYQKRLRKIAFKYWRKMFQFNPYQTRVYTLLLVLLLPTTMFFYIKSKVQRYKGD